MIGQSTIVGIRLPLDCCRVSKRGSHWGCPLILPAANPIPESEGVCVWWVRAMVDFCVVFVAAVVSLCVWWVHAMVDVLCVWRQLSPSKPGNKNGVSRERPGTGGVVVCGA
jgi:hypothetical protein